MSSKEITGYDKSWAERGVGDPIWEEDDYPDDDAVRDGFEDGEETNEAIWTEAFATHARRKSLRSEIAEANAYLASLSNGATYSVDPAAEDRRDRLVAKLVELDERWEYLEQEMGWRGLPPKGWTPPAAAPASPPLRAKTESTPDLLRRTLTAAEFEHYELLVAGTRQTDIAARFGVSQPAIVKREKALRSKVDAAYLEARGRPYPWVAVPKPQGGRKRKS